MHTGPAEGFRRKSLEAGDHLIHHGRVVQAKAAAERRQTCFGPDWRLAGAACSGRWKLLRLRIAATKAGVKRAYSRSRAR